MSFNNKIVPSHIQIETVAGRCNVRCNMCPIEKSIRKEIMSNDFFEKVVERLLPIKNNIKFFTLLGLGETLLDPGLPGKIKIAKKHGLPEVGVFSNGMALTEKLSTELLNSGLDVLSLSIDGFSKETQEAIRAGSNLDTIIKNVLQFVELREKLNTKTKIIVRFTRQEKNEKEWENFLSFWSSKLKNGDAVFRYDVHNAGHVVENKVDKSVTNLKCSEVYKRMIIFSDGSIGLCCGDQFGHYNIGNILDSDPIELYNHPLFVKYREEMDKGNILNLELCKDCTVMYSISNSKHIFI